MDSRHCSGLKIPIWGLFIFSSMGVLYLAQSVFIPIFLAMLIAFLLAPLITLLAKYHIPRALGSGIVILLMGGLITILFYYLAEPVGEWLDRLPAEIQQIDKKLSPFKDSIETVQETTQKVEEIASMNDGSDDKAADVVVKGPNILYSLLNSTQALLIGILSFIVLLYFMLAFGRSLVLRISLLFKEQGRHRQMFLIAKDVQTKLSRYLLFITLLNTLLGIVVGLVMWLVDMPTPAVWGASAAVLNYIPYVGPAINIGVVALVSLLTFDSLAQVLLPPALLLGLNLLEGQLIQPMFIGRMFTINPVLIFLFVLIWGWLWGMAGVFMAVPILVIINIILEQNSFREETTAVANKTAAS